MSLEDKLAEIREMAKTRQPPEVRAIMHQATDDLRASGIKDRVAQVGSLAPDFALPNAAGQLVSLAALRTRGPVVVSFYRGRW
ncbi:MAG TPA: hypothetical protein VMS64_35185 [Candidatus Methylomirabilis sp.]|nr:hypothetical protein [Candidatus Methylomirabilis sp.]